MFRKEDPAVRVESMHFLIAVGKAMRKSLVKKQKTVDEFATWILESIKDDNQEVAHAAFYVLRDMICGNCVNHFHQEKLPVRVTKENMEWINFFMKHYSMLLSRVKSMDIGLRYPALKPLTYISLMMVFFNLIIRC